MQIIFADKLIAKGPLEGGTDAIEGFLPGRKLNTQWSEPIDAKDSTPQSLSNRKRSMTGIITPKEFDDLGSAAQALLLYLDTVPDEGVLKISVGGKETTYARAVLEEVKAVERMGVTIKVSLTFLTGPGQDTTAPLTDGTNILNDGTGTNLHA